jgi:hypothetical protein
MHAMLDCLVSNFEILRTNEHKVCGFGCRSTEQNQLQYVNAFCESGFKKMVCVYRGRFIIHFLRTSSLFSPPGCVNTVSELLYARCEICGHGCCL